MTAVVFHDLSKITDRDVSRATHLAGADAIHALPADALWTATDSVARLPLPSMRDQATRARTLRQIWDLLEPLTDAHYRGIDLRDVTRYNLLFALERTFYVAWALSRLSAEFTGTVDWHTDCPETAKVLESLGNQPGLALRVHPTAIRREAIVHNWLRAARTRAWTLRREWQERRWTQAAPATDVADRRRPIVFTEYYSNSARVTLAIARHLREHSQARSVFVSSRLEVARAAEAAETPAVLLRTFPRARDLRARRRSLQTTWMLQLARLREKPIQLAPGGPDCRRIILPALEKEVSRAFAEAVALADDAHAMIDHLEPACVATTTSGSTFGRTMAAVASARGIPTAWVQHGLSTDDVALVHMNYDALLVWGEYDRRRYLEADVRGAIEIVGAPHYESLAKRARELPCDATPLNERREVNVLYLASRTGGATVTTAAAERLIRELTTAVQAIPNAVLTIKTHPGDRTKLAERLTASQDRVHVVGHGSSLEMILKCDVAVVTSSTAGLETCIVKKPLISFAYEGMPTGVDYAGYGAAYCVKSEPELAAALGRLWRGDGVERLREGQQRLVDDMLGGADGNALNRAAEILLRLANSTTAQEVR